jgi:hypothetical protein
VWEQEPPLCAGIAQNCDPQFGDCAVRKHVCLWTHDDLLERWGLAFARLFGGVADAC